MKKIIDFILHFIVPSEKNNFKARSLHHDFLSLYLVFSIVVLFGIKEITPYFHDVLGFATDISIPRLFESTNAERQKNNLAPLQLNDKLSLAAEKKAKDMFTKNYWAHYGPSGETPWDFILSSDYSYEIAGENLAKNFLFSQGVVDAWMNSQTHKDNLLKPEYADVGFAVVNGILNGEETTLVVQMFGKPSGKEKNTLAQTLDEASQPKTVSAAEPATDAAIITRTEQLSKKPASFSFFSLKLNATYVFLFFLVFVLFVDFIIASKMHIIRLSGKNIAHIIFITIVIVGTYIVMTKGSII